MKRILSLLPLALLAACMDTGAGPVAPEDQAAAEAKGKYIVVLKDPGLQPSYSRGGAPEVAGEAGIVADRVFDTVLDGFAAELTPSQVAALRASPRVAYVEEDAPVRLSYTQTPVPSWGLDRIDQLKLPLSNTFTYKATGMGVVAYVLDTGIRRTHTLFTGRASYIPNGAGGDFVGDGYGSAEDCHGHGTHVAGTIGSTTYGVAKDVRLVAARVVNCSGGGNASMAIAAMEWIAKNGRRPAVVNMSLGYGDVESVRDAAEALVGAGFFVAAAAGNGNYAGTPLNACDESPAGAPSVMTVGSTTSSDAESSFSNYGRCVDILAPGSVILSTLHTSDTATGTKSGTSMAAPHVAGVAAQYLQWYPASFPSAVVAALKTESTPGIISLHVWSAHYGTPNRFLRTVW